MIVASNIVLTLVVAPALCGDPITTQEICDWLAEQSASLNNQQVRFEERTWSGISVEPPDYLAPEEADYIIEWCLFLGAKGAFRVEERYQYDKRDSRAFKGAEIIRTWNGLVSRTSSHLPFQTETHQHQGVISSEIQTELFNKPWTTTIGWWVDLFGARTLADILGSEEVGSASHEGELSTWRFTPSFASWEDVHIVATRLPNDEIRIVRIVRDHYKSDTIHSPENLLFRRTYEFDIEFAPGTRIPSSAKITYTRRADSQGRPGEVVWEMRQVHSISSKAHIPTEGEFVADFHTAASVWDSRYRIGYELGSRHINVDGRVLATSRPIVGDVGPELESWISEGTFVGGSSPESPSVQPLRWIIIGTLVAAAILLLVTPRHVFKWLRFTRDPA